MPDTDWATDPPTEPGEYDVRFHTGEVWRYEVRMHPTFRCLWLYNGGKATDSVAAAWKNSPGISHRKQL